MKQVFLTAIALIAVNCLFGQTIIKLQNDTTFTSPMVFAADEQVIIDLNGKKIFNQTATAPFILHDHARILVKNGSVIPNKTWGTIYGDNARLEWYSLNVGEGEMTKNQNVPKSQFFLDGRPK